MIHPHLCFRRWRYLMLAALFAVVGQFAAAQTPIATKLPDDFDEGYFVKVRTGAVPGVSMLEALGHSDSVGTSLNVLYSEHSVLSLHDNIIAHAQSPEVVNVASTSVTDTSGGTGARTVRLTGLDAELRRVTETLTLSGQTAVTSTSVFYVVTNITTLTAGSSRENNGIVWVGTGTFTAGVPATALNAMEAGSNNSTSAIIAVPAGTVWVPIMLQVYSGDTSKDLRFNFEYYDRTRELSYEALEIHGKQSDMLIPVLAQTPLEEGDIVMVKATVDSNTSSVTVGVQGILMDKI